MTLRNLLESRRKRFWLSSIFFIWNKPEELGPDQLILSSCTVAGVREEALEEALEETIDSRISLASEAFGLPQERDRRDEDRQKERDEPRLDLLSMNLSSVTQGSTRGRRSVRS